MDRLHLAMTAIFLAAGSPYARGAGPELPPSRLIALAPIIDSREGINKVLRVTAHIDGTPDDALTLHLLFRAPGHYAALVVDTRDKTPIVFYCDGTILLNNCIDDYLFYSKNFQLQYTLKQSGDQINMDLDLKKVKPGHRNNFLVLDLKSLYTGSSAKNEVATFGDHLYLLRQTSPRGNAAISAVNTGGGIAFLRTDLIHVGEVSPMFTVEELTPETIGTWQEMPSLQTLRAKLKVREGEAVGPLENMSLYAYIDRVCYARRALKDSKLRQGFEAYYGIRMDWGKIEAEDRIRSERLHQMLSPCFKVLQSTPPPDLRQFQDHQKGQGVGKKTGNGDETGK